MVGQNEENYDLVRQEREIERKVKDVVDEREIGVKEIADAEAAKVEEATEIPKGSKKKDDGITRIKIPKDFNLQLRDGIVLVTEKEVEVRVLGAESPDAIAGTLAPYLDLYGAVRDDLAYDENAEDEKGKKFKRRVSFGAHGIRNVEDEEPKAAQVAQPTAAPALTTPPTQANSVVPPPAPPTATKPATATKKSSATKAGAKKSGSKK